MKYMFYSQGASHSTRNTAGNPTALADPYKVKFFFLFVSLLRFSASSPVSTLLPVLA